MPLTDKTIMLDLDSTLIYTSDNFDNYSKLELYSNPKNIDLRDRIYKFDIIDVVEKPGTGVRSSMWGILRPHVYEFLYFCFDYFSNVIVWSAGQLRYVHAICDVLFIDPEKQPCLIWSYDDCQKCDNYLYKPLIKKIKGLNLEKRLNRFQVRDVKLENSVKSLLEKDQVDLESHQTYVAQQLEAALSNYLPITLIPQKSRRGSIDDASIGLISVFNDRDNFQLKLPSPDYYIDVTVRDLKMIRSPSEGEYRRVADILSYGVFNTIELKESKTEEVKFSSKFFKKDSVLIRKDLDLESLESSRIKWGYYNVNQFKLFLNFAEQIKEKNLAKLKTITNNETIVNEMANIERLINK
jgi:hypothetical protein